MSYERQTPPPINSPEAIERGLAGKTAPWLRELLAAGSDQSLEPRPNGETSSMSRHAKGEMG